MARFARRRARAAGAAAPAPEPIELPRRLTLAQLERLDACPAAFDWLRSNPGASGIDLIDDPSADPYWGLCYIARSRPDLIRPMARALGSLPLPGRRVGASGRAAALAADDPKEAADWLARAAWVRPLPPLPEGGLGSLPPSKLARREQQKAEGRELRRLAPLIREVARRLVKP